MAWENKIATTLQWTKEISNREQKEAVAAKIAERVRDGDVIGVGSGSTSYLALLAISKKVKEQKLNVLAIPTSHEVSLTCSIMGLPTSTLLNARPDWYFDGADEVDPNKNLIKGRGGAMFAEKLVMKSAPESYILVDSSKFVSYLGEKFAAPIEFDPRAVNLVETELAKLGVKDVQMRMAVAKDGPVITEAGNLILDVRFNKIEDGYEKEIKSIPGVIESGLFIGYNPEILTT
ncbi:ribose 5-phosphate isomerase A [Cohnella sp. CIP 111063]|uniref:ribose 5-phosphate isomerase A n=1 Tax=unclassified Cohnella TaxID=2636738 RepID=UPI000B8C26F2|nr:MULTISPECIES: ribose 5-phosphate isomerase A [unclassified Cohnella]OXS57599.1 ribose 5-phosphate isomerase A [Cohnella sp. CIP 111063]PRX70978.1 ribose-5-phosphate isomerase [Cohnella sp. SGD-V74]